MKSNDHRETYGQQSFNVSRPGKDVTFVLPDPPSRFTSARTTIIIPPCSGWTAEPHWHEEHDELFVVKKGHVRLTVQGVTRIISPADGAQRVPAYDVHFFGRADTVGSHGEDKAQYAHEADQDVIVEEWTDPVDGLKEVFFRNIFSIIEEAPRRPTWRTTLQIFSLQAHCDDYPVLVSSSRAWQPLTHIVFFFATLIGGWLGLRPWYDEFTPPDLRHVAETRGQARSVDEQKHR